MPRYRTISDWFVSVFPGKVRKIAVNAHPGCPGRCMYCDNTAFSPSYSIKAGGSISAQLEEGIRFNSGKGPVWGWLAYFQSYTNTFGPTEKLIALYEEALAYPGVKGLVIATRPDCLATDLLDWFEARFGNGAPEGHPFLLVEIGVESTNDRTLREIRRGHDWKCASDAIRELDSRGINVGAHLILGFPGEDRQDFITHVRRLSALPIKTLKFHQLQIIKGSPMAERYLTRPEEFELFTAESYAGTLAALLKELRPDIALDRFVSESPKNMVLAPSWGLKPSEFSAILDSLLKNE